MSLLTESMEECIFMHKITIDNPEGGYNEKWTEGAKFKAAIVFNNSLEARVAEKEGVTSLYTVTVPKEINLRFDTVFKRLSDGLILRVTSRDTKDIQTPTRATFQIAQVSAEEFNPNIMG